MVGGDDVETVESIGFVVVLSLEAVRCPSRAMRTGTGPFFRVHGPAFATTSPQSLSSRYKLSSTLLYSAS